MQQIIKKNWIHGVAVLVFLLISLASFYPALQGKKLNQSDNTIATAKEVKDFEKETGEISRWTNSMFGGMPTYYIYGKPQKDVIDHFRLGLRLFTLTEVGIFFSAMLFFYLLMLVFRVPPLLSIFASICFAYTTNNIVLLATGHMTKLLVVSSSPIIIAGLILMFRQKRLLALLVFSLGMSLSIKNDHPQMTYYLGLTLIPFMVVYFIQYLKEKKIKEYFVNCGLLVIGLLLAFGTTASKVLPVKEYSEDTMRGKPILKKATSSFSSSSVEGLSWDYAMNWSNGTVDLLQSFIPFSVGGSNSHRVSSDSNFAKELRKFGQNTRKGVDAPLYWGKLPFTSGPIYFGAIIFMLFFISLFTLKDNLKWWLLSGVLLTMLLSMGKNLEFFSRFFYDYVPMYKMFRTPNSVLSVTPLIITIGAFWGLSEMIKKNLNFKKILYPGLGLAVFCIGFGLLAPSFFDMVGQSDARYAQMGLDTSVLIKDRAAVTQASSLKSGFLMLAVLAALWAFYNEKIKKNTLVILVGALSMFDLFSTNFHYVTPSKYLSSKKINRQVEARPVDLQILQDKDPNYRVLDLSIPTFDSPNSSYHHKTIGGYHAAKLVRYQDIIDYHLSQNNMNVLNMLNTKYIITKDAQDKVGVQRNTAALGNAWFVNSVQTVTTNEDEINELTDFDPLGTAIVHDEFSSYLKSKSFNKNGTIRLTSYKPNELIYTSNSSSDQFAVFSEIWYGPNKGWQAYIDGKEVDHIRANYVLRAMNIPSGQHEIKFRFDPQSVKTGGLVSMIISLIVMILLIIYLINHFRPEDKKWFEYK